QERPPGHDPVEEPAAVLGLDVRALAALHEQRLVEADPAHRADRRVHAAGNQLERTAVESRTLAEELVSCHCTLRAARKASDARTQGAPIALLSARLRTPQRDTLQPARNLPVAPDELLQPRGQVLRPVADDQVG